ncbi:hypothetical protein MLD38_024965 [Melastoma candidum]|uniref:Uncharacterized protein n=1 Tax=Melastoma candidum TaxID=119954 RepID=A0ACB9NZ17_9MYRT|nr:hypothetical protein MLD38_024965 [Melastoma candidum]
MPTPPLLVLVATVFISLSLLVSADLPSENTTGSTPPAPAKRPGTHQRGGIRVPIAHGVVNVSGATVTPPPAKRINLFLDAHNVVRAKFGEPPLVWDRNLAKYARNWANGRVADCKMLHSGGPYGENIFWGSRNHWTAIQIVNMWVDEVQYYDPVNFSCQDGEICGHYTQVVWRDTSKVGCSRVTCNNGGMYAICVYDPPGNYIGENPFAHNER